VEINYFSIFPEIVLSLAGIIIMLLIPSTQTQQQAKLAYVALVGIGIALLAALTEWGASEVAFSGTISHDNFAVFSKILFLFAVGSIIAVSIQYLEENQLLKAEYFSLLLFATVGMCLMASSVNLILTFLALEVLSIATYILAGFQLKQMKSTEAALKYFILGAFSTAFLLYGIAFIYGATGSIQYFEIAATVDQMQTYPLSLLLGVGLLVVGFGFKVALAPFHVWAPDVYEGSPVPITAHLAVASKAAALIALVRFLYQVIPDLGPEWQQILWFSSILTMLIGNIAALTQTNIKRMLAYSSIAHAGYLLVGVVALNDLGSQGVLFYLLAYAFMNLGAFTVVQLIGRQGEQYVNIQDYVGIGFRYPFLTVSLSIFLLSLAGIPLTAGFTGKLFLFAAAIQSEMYWLVVFAVIASAIGVYYYLRILVYMFMHESETDSGGIHLPMIARVIIVIMVLGTLYLGVFPGSFLHFASEAVNF